MPDSQHGSTTTRQTFPASRSAPGGIRVGSQEYKAGILSILAGAVLLAPGHVLAQSDDGSFVTDLRAEHSSQCLTAAGSNIEQGACSQSNAQRFNFIPVEGVADTYTVQSDSAARCLEVSSERSSEQFGNSPVVNLQECQASASQQFKLIATENGGSVLRTPDGQCLDVAGASADPNAALISFECHGMDNQRFAVATPDDAAPVDAAAAPAAPAAGAPAPSPDDTSDDVVAADTATDDMAMDDMTPEDTAVEAVPMEDVPADDAAMENMPADGMAMNDMSMEGMAKLPASELPDGMPGSGELLLEDKPLTTYVDHPDVAAFRLDCQFSHMNYDDAIVKPGEPGAAHLHQYFGNTDVDANSTNDSIINSGNSTCAGGIANRSAYWTPALIDSRTDQPLKPERAVIYYKTGLWGDYAANTVAPPNGLRLIAGDQNRSAPDGDGVTYNRYITFSEWFCYPPTPNGLRSDITITEAMPTNCKAGDQLRMRVRFPNCWDGQNLDSADHKSHMAYSHVAFPNVSATNRPGCPASHPVQIPTMAINVDWTVQNAADVQHLRLSSDMYDDSIPAGYSAHGDWIVGWDESIMERMIEGCYRPAYDCNHNNLNDGQGLKKLSN